MHSLSRVKQQHMLMVTSCMRGVFREDDKARAEFLRFIRG